MEVRSIRKIVVVFLNIMLKDKGVYVSKNKIFRFIERNRRRKKKIEDWILIIVF